MKVAANDLDEDKYMYASKFQLTKI